MMNRIDWKKQLVKVSHQSSWIHIGIGIVLEYQLKKQYFSTKMFECKGNMR